MVFVCASLIIIDQYLIFLYHFFTIFQNIYCCTKIDHESSGPRKLFLYYVMHMYTHVFIYILRYVFICICMCMYYSLTLFMMTEQKGLPTSFSSVTSTNVGISFQNFLTFSFNTFARLV